MSDNRLSPTIQNRKVRYNYHVLEEFEVGIMLTGTEIKSIRESKISMGESFITINKDIELFWHSANIDEYSHGNRYNHRPQRIRKLLAHKHEILKMYKATEIKGLTIVPLKLYFKKGCAKLQIALCRGKDNQDKRQDLIGKTQKREMDRAMKNARLR